MVSWLLSLGRAMAATAPEYAEIAFVAKLAAAIQVRARD